MISKIISTTGQYKEKSIEIIFSADKNNNIIDFNLVDNNFKLLGTIHSGSVEKVLPNNDCIIRLENDCKAFLRYSNKSYKQNDQLTVQLIKEPKDGKPFSCIEVKKEAYAKNYIDIFKRIINAPDDTAVITDNDNPDIWIIYSITGFLDKLIKPIKYLKDGSNIYIEYTKALTVIDVNAGKNNVKASDYFKEINYQAAREVVKQLRINNISGMIIIDFINMNDVNLDNELTLYLQELLSDDYCKCTVYGFTKGGVLELSRQRIFSPLYKKLEQFC
ncbi:MAG: ribonuclease E/G [Pseudobutyrivibrio sp.]|nr:ribonuclease E/G [Pseudobutyrivibrio sp.]